MSGWCLPLLPPLLPPVRQFTPTRFTFYLCFERRGHLEQGRGAVLVGGGAGGWGGGAGGVMTAI